MENKLIESNFVLQKIPGKGGWTYADIPIEKQILKKPFGWIKVRGFIDSFEIRHYHLMPTGKGKVFLPIKAEIRKKINKKAGDTVRIVLYEDIEPLYIPEEFILCLSDDPIASKFFKSLRESEQKFYVQWIYSAKREETKIKRMADSISKLANKQKLYQPIKKEL